LRDFGSGEVLRLWKFYEIVIAVLANPLPIQVVLIGYEGNSFRNIGGIRLSSRIEIEETFNSNVALQLVVRHHNSVHGEVGVWCVTGEGLRSI